jgi:hypothetical protein
MCSGAFAKVCCTSLPKFLEGETQLICRLIYIARLALSRHQYLTHLKCSR